MKPVRLLLVLLLLIVVPLSPAWAREYGAGKYFSIVYDERAYQLDDLTYCDESTGEDHVWFFILYNDEFMFDVSMSAHACDGGISLASADAAQKTTYLSCVLSLNSADNATLLQVVEAGESQIPFYLFSLHNEDGPYLKAETVVNGQAFDFLAYYNDSSKPVDQRLQDELIKLLGSFKPFV